MTFKLKGSGSGGKGKKVSIPAEVKRRVDTMVMTCLRKAEIELGFKPLEMPNIRYDQRGTTAGTAQCSKWEINLNSILLMENLEDMINETVPHEVAHLIAGKVFGPRIRSHGQEWQRVMLLLGKKPSRCHNYDTTNARTRTQIRFAYSCDCAEPCRVGPRVHPKIQKGSTHYCKGCKSKLYGLPFRKVEK